MIYILLYKIEVEIKAGEDNPGFDDFVGTSSAAAAAAAGTRSEKQPIRS